jgi:hypothetical protein
MIDRSIHLISTISIFTNTKIKGKITIANNFLPNSKILHGKHKVIEGTKYPSSTLKGSFESCRPCHKTLTILHYNP